MAVFSELRYPTTRVAKLLTAMLAIVLFAVLAAAIISGFILHQILWPARHPSDIDLNLLLGHPTEYSFTLPDGKRREGWFFPGLMQGPTIVVCHGYQSQRASILTLVTALQEHQYNLFLFDFTGHGAVPGSTTLGYREAEEVRAAIAGLEQREDIDRGRFGIWGTDLGAYAALYAATSDPHVAAVVVDSVYTDPTQMLLLEANRSGLGVLPLVKPFCVYGFLLINYRYRHLPPLSARLAGLRGIPKLFIQSRDDPVLADQTMRLFLASPEPRQQAVDDTAYAEMDDQGRRAYETMVVNFFLQHLPLRQSP